MASRNANGGAKAPKAKAEAKGEAKAREAIAKIVGATEATAPAIVEAIVGTIVPSSEGAATVATKAKARKGVGGGFLVYPFLDSFLADAGRAFSEGELVEAVAPTILARRPDYDVASRVALYFRDAANRATTGTPSRSPRKPRGRTGGTIYGPRRPNGEATLVYDPKATIVVASPEVGAEGATVVAPATVAPATVAPATKAKAPKGDAFAREAAKATKALARDGAERDARREAKARRGRAE